LTLLTSLPSPRQRPNRYSRAANARLRALFHATNRPPRAGVWEFSRV